MKLFSCPACGQVLFFGNVKCERCDAILGYEPERNRMLVLGTAWKYCANHTHAVCNWLLPADATAELCRACRHNSTIPDLSVPENVELWRKIEEAKHRLLYTILRLGLPLFDRDERPDGLGFEFLRADHGKVITGHAHGLITIALVEADDAEREKRRHALGEPYRTLLGHFRHEVG
ncbi:MAG: putative zinc-binding metallopeptidase, partial [Kofleriaceae bacterium]